MIQAGDENPGPSNNNLDGAMISGNYLKWIGTFSPSIITHGLFTGYNKNMTVKHNYLENVPYGIIFKSGTDSGVNMTITSGGCAYNVCKNGKFAVRMKGINGLKIYNNTFYNDDNGGLCLIMITSNADRTIPSPSTGVKIYNNIFYATSRMAMIRMESGSLSDFQCDYNVYWCEVGEPFFAIDGTNISWEQWRAKGYDAHSKVINPNFNNSIDFVPSTRLDFGKDLGSEWQSGLATSARWVVGSSPATTNQNGTWQVGARLYQRTLVSGITVTGASGSKTIDTNKGTLQLTALVLPNYAAEKSVKWTVVNGSELATVSIAGLVTAIANGNITVRATATDGSGIYGELGISIINQNVLIRSISFIDNLTNDTINGIGTKLAFKATINPPNATNQSLVWSVENLTGKASIDANGLLTTISQGSINVIAEASDGSLVRFQKKYVIAVPTTMRDNQSLSEFKIFPNPSQGKIQIQFSSVPPEGIIVEIIGVKGQIFEKKRIFESLSEWKISQYSSNILFIRVTGQRSSITKKVIISNSFS
jgi:uncharacterized protein YjdB